MNSADNRRVFRQSRRLSNVGFDPSHDVIRILGGGEFAGQTKDLYQI